MTGVYAALRAVGVLVECSALHEPVDGWVWVRCGDLGALLRDYARLLASGRDAGLVMTPRGELLDVLELERADLSGILAGEIEVACAPCEPLSAIGKLVELGARRAAYRQGRLAADLEGIHLEALLRLGLVPAPWRKV